MQNELFKVLIPVLLSAAVFTIILGILELIGMSKIFKKAGEKGWKAIIPYYNIWTLNEISECKWWYFLLAIASSIISFSVSYTINTESITLDFLDLIASLANVYAMYMINYNVAKKFNKSHGFATGMTLLPFIFYPILGLGKEKFNKDIKVSPYGVIKEGDK